MRRALRRRPATMVVVACVGVAVYLAAVPYASAYSIWSIGGDGAVCSTAPACGDGGAATAAALNYPEGVAVGPDGSVYIADWGDSEVRKISPNGTITIVAGDGTACVQAPACGDGGPATGAQLSFPDGVAVDRAGNVYIADTGDNEIRRVSPKGTITRIAGTGAPCAAPPRCGDGGPATGAQLSSPEGVAVDRAGNVYIADTGDNEIRRVSPKGTITRIAGTGAPCGTAPRCGDGGPATGALLSFPAGVAVDAAGAVYIADDGDNEIRRVSRGGVITRLAGDGAMCASPPACGDGGAAAAAKLGGPDGVAVDSRGDVYIADDLDNEIREVSRKGTITRIAGSGAACAAPPGCGSAGAALTAQLDYPDALALDPAGDVYLADTYDQQIRLLLPAPAAAVRAGPRRIALLAFAVIAAGRGVTVRYVISAPAVVRLSARGPGQPPSVVAARSARAGLGELEWRPRRTPARGRYTLTVTASLARRTVASSINASL